MKLISIMAVWDEQNMIAASIESTKDIVFEYIVIIKKGIDKTKEVVELCKEKWQLNIQIIESELKLREARKLGFEIAKNYADYFLIQDGDEIYYTDNERNKNNQKSIMDLISENYDICSTSMIYLKENFLHTLEEFTWITPHPFLIKNVLEIFWLDKGDLPYLNFNWELKNYKIYTTDEKKNPFKFDCNIKNYRRQFLRSVFTHWHDGNYEGTIEQYAFEYHYHSIWYKNNIDKNETDLEKIILFYEKNNNKYMFLKKYDETKYVQYPEVIKKYIEIGLIYGLNNIDNLKLI
jgi:hypothetical protein